MSPEGTESLLLLAEAIRASGSGRLTLRGESMSPTLQEGWNLHVRSVRAEALQVGDIGAFLHGNVLTIHRLVWRKTLDGQPWLIFQGDNNPVRELVAADAVLGKVEAAQAPRADGSFTLPFPVGRDERAWFYRSIYRLHRGLSGFLPGLSIPLEGESGGYSYRLSRALFRVLEPLFSPRSRR